MKVYKYLDAHWGRVALYEQRLKVSKINELNDPFDFMSVAPKTVKERQVFNKMLEDCNDKYGIISFSKTWQEPLLWSHYAESHRGICLEFDVIEGAPFWDMEYISNREPISVDRKHRDTNMALLSEIPRKKHISWQYECEVRILRDLKNEKHENIDFMSFHEFSKLSGVFLGPRYESTNSLINSALALHNIPVITTRLAFKDYKVVEQKNESMGLNI